VVVAFWAATSSVGSRAQLLFVSFRGTTPDAHPARRVLVWATPKKPLSPPKWASFWVQSDCLTREGLENDRFGADRMIFVGSKRAFSPGSALLSLVGFPAKQRCQNTTNSTDFVEPLRGNLFLSFRLNFKTEKSRNNDTKASH